MRVEKTTTLNVKGTLNGKEVTWTKELSDHDLEEGAISFVNSIVLIEQSADAVADE